jgi:hypothetical protein
MNIHVKSIKEMVDQLNESIEHHKQLLIHGGQDPFYTDGCNANLIRNHVIYYKNKIKELSEEKGLEFPEEYFTPTPEVVDNTYMAREDEIRKNAIKAFEIMENNEDYQYLKRIDIDYYDADKEIHNNILNYVNNLKRLIEKDDLVGMRRYERYERYLESFQRQRILISNSMKAEKIHKQMTLF